MKKERLLGIPSLWTIGISIVLIVVFMCLAGYLYSSHAGSQYWLKVADSLINGSIVTILFALLKAMFDLPKWRQERRSRRASK